MGKQNHNDDKKNEQLEKNREKTTEKEKTKKGAFLWSAMVLEWSVLNARIHL